MLLVVALAPAESRPVAAQSGAGANCPEVVERALSSIEVLCTGMGRNETCYGYNRVDALFWQENSQLVFAQPSDRVPLADLRTIATAPLDLNTGLWGVAALHLYTTDLPNILPGQAVMFLLMGDTTLENRVPPDQAAGPVTPVALVTVAETRLYTTPTTAANTLGTLPENTTVQAIGLDDTGEWVQIRLSDGSTAWLSGADLNEGDLIALQDLPVTYGANAAPRYAPMQSFYFTTGFSGPSCNEAPDALVVQSPEGLEVSFNVNDLEVQIGSTVAFTTVAAPDGSGRRVLVAVLFEGHLTITINGQTITLTEPGQTFAITLNEDGLVDENSEFVPLGAEPLSEWVENACLNALTSGMFSKTNIAQNCAARMTFYTDQGFMAALGLPVNPPAPFPPPPAPPAAVVLPPFQWPQITDPASGTTLVGNVNHMTSWTSAPGASSYMLEVFPDTTNQAGYFVTFGPTGATSYDVPLGQMPSRPEPGWGYFMRVIPLDANGAPLAPPEQAPLTWVRRLDATPPPPAATEEPGECYEVCDGLDCWMQCPPGCEWVCDGECWMVCYPSEG